jgi:3-oxoacyl-[acyl-carrier protein] reductase
MTDEWEEQISRSLIGKIPLGRFAEPSEIAEAIMFLLSEKSDFITGETLNVNGGLLMD